jgi:hypothetical protein
MNGKADEFTNNPVRNSVSRYSGVLTLDRLSFIWSRSQVELLAFCLIALSMLDLLTTYALLRSFSECYEANPIADFFFKRWNILGMTLFKFSLVGVVITSSEIIERSRPRWGKVVLVFACLAAGVVVAKGMQILSLMIFPEFYLS